MTNSESAGTAPPPAEAAVPQQTALVPADLSNDVTVHGYPPAAEPGPLIPSPTAAAIQRAVMRDTRLGMEAGAVPAVRLTRVTGDYAQSAPDDDIPAFLDRRGRGAA